MDDWQPPNSRFASPMAKEPPLHRAARLGDCSEIRSLVAQGADVNEKFDIALVPGASEREATPLMIAAGSGDGADIDTLRTLLELGADPKVRLDGRSAASFAVEGLGGKHLPGGDAARLKLLLEAGSPLPSDPIGANRLLCEVAAAGDPGRLSILLDRGFNPRGHFDPEAAKKHYLAAMKHIQKLGAGKPDVFASMPEEIRESVAQSMKKMYDDQCERAGSAPANFEIPLFCAAESGSADCVRLLLESGAKARARDNSSRTAMYYANSVEVVQELIHAGVPIEDEDQHEWSPLDASVSEGLEALPRIRALLIAGANVNATHDRGYTVFMSAVGSGRHPEVLRLLIAAGADPHTVSKLGYNAFHAAIDVNGEANDEDSVRDTLSYLKQLGLNIEQRNHIDHTPLARAIKEGTGVEVQVLCELGADPNAVCPSYDCGGKQCDRVDLPLLFHAADGFGVENHIKVEALLNAGADPLAKDSEGHTPLVHVVSALCSKAKDHEGSFRAFFSGLRELRLSGGSASTDHETLIAEVTPRITGYVESFSNQIRFPQTDGYEGELRKDRISCIVLLCAYEISGLIKGLKNREV